MRMVRPAAGAALALLLTGCCAVVPDGEKYFARNRSADETVRLFRYSVEAGQYGGAYRCLTASFREKHSEREFSLAVRYGSFQGRDLHELIVGATQDEEAEPVQGFPPARAVWITLIDVEDPEDDASDVHEHSLFVLLEGGQWLIDPEMSRPQHESFFREMSRGQ